MKKLCLLMMICATPMTAGAFELWLFAGQQAYKNASQFKDDHKITAILRAGYSVVDLGPALIELTAGYQPETTAKLTSGTDFKNSHFSVGAMANFKAYVSTGVGLEYRFEKLDTGTSTNYGRPWARANVGIAIPSPVLKPFIGLEADIPLTSTKGSLVTQAKDMAPKSQIGIYGGIRF